MVDKSKLDNDFNYFLVCEDCQDEQCCADPYITFCASNEIEKIKEKVRDFPKKFQNFLDLDTIMYKNEKYQYHSFKKNKGKCIFLKNRRVCLIHNEKPLHCRCFPLVWSYEEEGNKLFIYIDEDPSCPLSNTLSKDTQWINNMKKIITAEVQQMSKWDRIAFASLETDATIRLIDVISLP